MQQQHTVLYDEFGFNLGIQRSRGRDRRGGLFRDEYPLQRGSNASVIMAIDSVSGIIYYEIQETGFVIDGVVTFIGNTLNILQANQVANPVFVGDNAPCHGEDEISEILEYYNYGDYNFLPPYSPMLNPIEEVIGDVKTDIHRQLALTKRYLVLNIHALPLGQKHRARVALLKQCLDEAVQNVTFQQIQAHFQHMIHFLPVCFYYLNL